MVLPILIPLAAELAASTAPWLLRHFVGEKAGDTAEKVIAVAREVTGKADPEAAVAAIKADPALLLQFRTRAHELDNDLQKAFLADRQDARQRDVTIRAAGGRNTRADLMVAGAATVLISCLACLVLLKMELTGEAVGIISTIAGIAGACLKDAFQFEFGSSRGSKDKDVLRRQQ